MPSHYQYGIVAERRIQKELEEEGFATIRAASSKGNYDIVATRADVVRFISVKRCPDWKTATTVYRAERRRLERLEIPSTPKIQRVLAIWSDKVAEGATGRGGLWYCIELVPVKKEEK